MKKTFCLPFTSVANRSVGDPEYMYVTITSDIEELLLTAGDMVNKLYKSNGGRDTHIALGGDDKNIYVICNDMRNNGVAYFDIIVEQDGF